jgi:hypothetical protein
MCDRQVRKTWAGEAVIKPRPQDAAGYCTTSGTVRVEAEALVGVAVTVMV